VFTSLIGFGAVLFPVSGISSDMTNETTVDRLGVLVWIWALFMVTALPAAAATLLARHRVEFILIPFFTTALLVANVSVWFNTVSDDPTLIARASASSALLCLLCVRWLALNRLNRTNGIWTRTER
jgi:hypothetical protein